MMLRSVLAALLVLLSGCSSADIKAAETEVAQFQQRLDAGDTGSIWAASAPALKNSGSKAEFDAFLKIVRGKLGKVQSRERTGWRVHRGTGGSTVELAYSARFEHGPGTETFVFAAGEPPRLVGYHVNSPALLTR